VTRGASGFRCQARAWRRSESLFALNARNSYGGYTGRQNWMAWFRDGRLERMTQSRRGGSDLDAEIAGLTDRLLERCPRIPDAEVQRLLAN